MTRKSCGKKSEQEEFDPKFRKENGQKENSPEEEKSASLKTDGKWKETSHGLKENSEDQRLDGNGNGVIGTVSFTQAFA